MTTLTDIGFDTNFNREIKETTNQDSNPTHDDSVDGKTIEVESIPQDRLENHANIYGNTIELTEYKNYTTDQRTIVTGSQVSLNLSEESLVSINASIICYTTNDATILGVFILRVDETDVSRIVIGNTATEWQTPCMTYIKKLSPGRHDFYIHAYRDNAGTLSIYRAYISYSVIGVL